MSVTIAPIKPLRPIVVAAETASAVVLDQPRPPRAIVIVPSTPPTPPVPEPGPVLTLILDDLELDPPVYSFSSDQAGTLRWDFHTSATPPAAGAGNIGTGTQAAALGANSFNLDLAPYLNQTGYLHFRVGASNVLTSQVITVPGTVILDRFVATIRDRAAATLNTRF